MNTQYPAGTGFDPRYQRPNGMNVGGVGNIYTPQPKEEEEGVNPLAVLAGLAAAGATAVGGYYGGKKLGMWGKGKPPATAVADNVPTGRIGRTGNLYADLNNTAGSTEASKVREDILNDARFYGRTKENSGAEMVVGDHIRAGSPNAKWRKDALALGQLNRGLGLSPFSGEYDDSAATLRAYAEGVREELLGKPSGSTQVSNAQKPTLTDIVDTPKVAQTAQELLADTVRNQTGIGDEAWDSGPATGAIPGINTDGYVQVDNNDDLWMAGNKTGNSLTDIQNAVTRTSEEDFLNSMRNRSSVNNAVGNVEATILAELAKPPLVGSVTPREVPAKTQYGYRTTDHNHLVPTKDQIPLPKRGDDLRYQQRLARLGREKDWAERRERGLIASQNDKTPGTVNYQDPKRGGWSKDKLDIMLEDFVDPNSGDTYPILRPQAAMQAAADGWISPDLATDISQQMQGYIETGGTISEPLASSLSEAYAQVAPRFNSDPHGLHIPLHSITGDIELVNTKGSNITNALVKGSKLTVSDPRKRYQEVSYTDSSSRDFSPLEAWMIGPDGTEGTAQSIPVSTDNLPGRTTLPGTVMAYTDRYVPRKGIEDITFSTVNPGQTGNFAIGSNPYEEYVYGENSYLARANEVGHNYDGKGEQVIDSSRFGRDFTRDEIANLMLSGRKTLPERTIYSRDASAIGGDRRYGYGKNSDNPRGVKTLSTYSLDADGLIQAIQDGAIKATYGDKRKGTLYTNIPGAIGMRMPTRGAYTQPYGQISYDGLPAPKGVTTSSPATPKEVIDQVIGRLADLPDNNFTKALQARQQGDTTTADISQELTKAFDHLERWNLNAAEYNQQAKEVNSLIGSSTPRRVEGVVAPFVQRNSLGGRTLSEALREDLAHDPREPYLVTVPDPAKPGSTKVVNGRSPSELGYRRLLKYVHGGDRVADQMAADGTTILQRVPHNDGIRVLETQFQAPRSQQADALEALVGFEFPPDQQPIGGTPKVPLSRGAKPRQQSQKDMLYADGKKAEAVEIGNENVKRVRDNYLDDINRWNEEETRKRYEAIADSEVFPEELADRLIAAVRTDEDIVANNPRYFENAVDIGTRDDLAPDEAWRLGPGGAPRSSRLKIGDREFELGPIEEKLDALRIAESQYDAAINGEEYGLQPAMIFGDRDRESLGMRKLDPATAQVTKDYLMSNNKPQVVTRRYVDEEGNNASKRLYIGNTMQDMEKRYRAYSDDRYPVGSTVKNLYDYYVPVNNVSNLEIIADRDPEGVVGLALEAGYTPDQMVTQILANPENYSDHAVNQARKGKIPDVHIVFPEKGGNKNFLPMLAGVSEELKRSLNYKSAPIEDAIHAGRFDANKYLGKTSVIPAKGLVAARTMTRVNEDGMAVPIQGYDRKDALGNYEYQNTKDLVGPTMAYQRIQRDFPELRPGYEPNAAGSYSRIGTKETVTPYTYTSPLRVNVDGSIEPGPGGAEVKSRGDDYVANLRVNNVIPVSRMVERGKRLGLLTNDEAASYVAQDKLERPSLYGQAPLDLRTDYEKGLEEQAARREQNRQIIRKATEMKIRRAPLAPQKLIPNAFAEDGGRINLQDAQAIIDDRKPKAQAVTPTTKAALQRGLDRRADRVNKDRLRKFGRYTFVEDSSGQLTGYDDVTSAAFGSGLPGYVKEEMANNLSMDDQGRLVTTYQGQSTPIQPAPRVNLSREDVRQIQRKPNTNQEQNATQVIGDVLSGKSVEFANDSDAIRRTGMTTNQLRSEASKRNAGKEKFSRKNPAQKSLFGDQEYVNQYEELVPFITPEGRMARGTQREIDRIANTQAQEADMAKIRRMSNGEKGIQNPLPGILGDTQLSLFDVGPLTSRRETNNQRQRAMEQIDQTVNQRIAERVYQKTIPGLNIGSNIDANSPGYVQQRLGNGNVVRRNYGLPESTYSKPSLAGAEESLENVALPSTDLNTLVNSAVSKGTMTKENAIRYYSAKLAEQQAVQRRRNITPEMMANQLRMDQRIERLNDAAEIPKTSEELRRGFVAANQGVQLRNLNG